MGFSSEFRNSERGESLLTVMVAVAILGILVMIMTQVFSNQNQAQSALELRTQFESLRRDLMNSVSCQDTLDQCDGTAKSISLLRKRGGKTEEVPTGSAKIEAACVATGGITVNATIHRQTRKIDIGCGSGLDSPDAEKTCEALGGIWDAARKCVLMNSGGLVRKSMTEPADPKQVIGCDIKSGGGGGDLKTCSEDGGKKSCVYKSGQWQFVRGKGKPCYGGIVVDTDK